LPRRAVPAAVARPDPLHAARAAHPARAHRARRRAPQRGRPRARHPLAPRLAHRLALAPLAALRLDLCRLLDLVAPDDLHALHHHGPRLWPHRGQRPRRRRRLARPR
ncbi:hypothetical protein BN1708_017202, partial [Verticillium longisporum]